MSDSELRAPKPLVDEYGNVHHIADELARGGQGVVYRTKDADLAVKQPLDASGQPDKTPICASVSNASACCPYRNVSPFPCHSPFCVTSRAM